MNEVSGWPSPLPPGSSEHSTLNARPVESMTATLCTERVSKIGVRPVAGLVGDVRRGRARGRCRARTQPLLETMIVSGSSMTWRSNVARSASSIWRAARVAVCLRVVADLLGDELLHLGVAAEQALQLLALALQLLQLGLDLDAFEARELPQPDLQDVLGLHLGQLELLHQLGLGLVRIADDLDHLVDVEEDDDAAFEDVDAPLDLRRAGTSSAA